jgi:hypothetical protein
MLVRPSGSRRLATVLRNAEYWEMLGFQHSILKSRDAAAALDQIAGFVRAEQAGHFAREGVGIFE